jgi:hypothetical protein
MSRTRKLVYIEQQTTNNKQNNRRAAHPETQMHTLLRAVEDCCHTT